VAPIYRPGPDGKENTFLCQEDILAWNRVPGVSRRAGVAGAVVLGTGGAGQTLLAVFNRRGGRVAPIYRVDRRWPSSLTEIPRWPIVVDPGAAGRGDGPAHQDGSDGSDNRGGRCPRYRRDLTGIRWEDTSPRPGTLFFIVPPEKKSGYYYEGNQMSIETVSTLAPPLAGPTHRMK